MISMQETPAPVPDSVVAIARSRFPHYGELAETIAAPELPGGQTRNSAAVAVRELFTAWGLDAEHAGTRTWNPLGVFIPPRSRVVLKPNWVLHYNQSGAGLDCLVTHPEVIAAVMEYVALTNPASVVIGDAPVQGCDFARLAGLCGLDALVSRYRVRGIEVCSADFRRTILHSRRLGAGRSEDVHPQAGYTIFDLGRASLLEGLAEDAGRFRVTMYNPDLLNRTHAPGRHQYLIARELVEADVVVNLPKLKTHRKAGVTGALKNLVGINGNKEYLPHHRKGGSADGGDCYPGNSWPKRRAEDLLDIANRQRPGMAQSALARTAELLARAASWLGADADLEGAWYGNDTVWRTCLDLQRILRYGLSDGTLAAEPVRRVITITDAIVAGEGEGPLANTPAPCGVVTGGLSPPAIEWVHALLMGFDPRRISLIRESFGDFPFGLVTFAPGAIRVRTAAGESGTERLRPSLGRPFQPPAGWRGHCELVQTDDALPAQQTVVA
jgi:uncharacterized protein (DUF362 family)